MKQFSNHYSGAFILGNKFERIPFLNRNRQRSSEAFNDFRIVDGSEVIGVLTVTVDSGVNVINLFYVFENYRKQGYFTRYMRIICESDIHFVLQPVPLVVKRANGDSPQDTFEWYFYALNEEQSTNTEVIEWLSSKYQEFGLVEATVEDSKKRFLTNYSKGENPRVRLING